MVMLYFLQDDQGQLGPESYCCCPAAPCQAHPVLHQAVRLQPTNIPQAGHHFAGWDPYIPEGFQPCEDKLGMCYKLKFEKMKSWPDCLKKHDACEVTGGGILCSCSVLQWQDCTCLRSVGDDVGTMCSRLAFCSYRYQTCDFQCFS